MNSCWSTSRPRLQPQSLAGTDQPIEVAAWTELPSIHVRGEQDLIPRALATGFLEQCTQVIDLPTGHCPQWSRPELVADLLHAQARAIRPPDDQGRLGSEVICDEAQRALLLAGGERAVVATGGELRGGVGSEAAGERDDSGVEGVV